MNTEVSIRNGYWFPFDSEKNRIVAFGSAWSGMEKIFVNDELVSKKRNMLNFNSRHEFEIDGEKYEVFYLVTGWVSGEIECLLLKGNTVIGREQKAYVASEAGRKGMKIATIAGFVAGAISAFLITRNLL